MSEFNIQNSKIEQLNDKGDNYKLVSESGNNAVARKGNVVQASGSDNKVQVDHPKEGLWSALWKKLKAGWSWIFG